MKIVGIFGELTNNSMKKPILDSFERMVITETNGEYRDRLLLKLSILHLKREIGRVFGISLLSRMVKKISKLLNI